MSDCTAPERPRPAAGGPAPGEPDLAGSRYVPITLATAPQHVEARGILSQPIAPGTLVRLAGDSLRSVMSGFDAETLMPANDGAPDSTAAVVAGGGAAAGTAWPILGGRLPRPQPKSGVDRAPRQLLLARCPGAAAGQTILVGGTFWPEGAGHSPTLAPYAGVPITFRLEVPDDGATGSATDTATASLGDETAWQPASDWFGFVLRPASPDHLQASLDSDGNVAVGVFDRFLNPVAADVEGCEAILSDGTSVQVAFPDSAEGAPRGARAALPARPAPGTRVTVRDGRGRETLSTPMPIASPEGERLLFGEFHWHTEASGDGARPLADAYRSARDGLLLDYAGAADHFPFEPPPSRYPNGLSLRDCADVADSFDAPGAFVTLLGVELSWRMGHYNFYWADRTELDLFLAAWEARQPGPLAGMVYAPDIAAFYGLPPDYFERAHPQRTLVIPHHTNVTAANVFTPNGLPVWTHYHWPQGHYDPRFFRLAEIVQTRGCFETEATDDDWKVKWGAGGGSLRTALARGFRVGFTGGTDNHCGWPARQSSGWVGMTAVYAEEFSRAGIMRGLYRRRCYATTGTRIVLDWRLNGHAMGSELRLGPAQERCFSIRVHGTAPLDRVEIVSQGVTIARLPVDGPDLVAEWIDDRRTRPVHDCYYYLRVRQRDGHCAWASPIWVDLALPEDGGRSLGGPVAWS